MVMSDVRQGVVIRISEDSAWIRIPETARPMSCGRECGGCTFCRHDSGNHIELQVEVPEGRRLMVGERVSLEYGEASATWAGLLLFAPTLAGIFLGGWIIGAAGMVDDVAVLAGMGVGAAAGMAATYCLSRLLRARFKPRIRFL